MADILDANSLGRAAELGNEALNYLSCNEALVKGPRKVKNLGYIGALGVMKSLAAEEYPVFAATGFLGVIAYVYPEAEYESAHVLIEKATSQLQALKDEV